MKITSLALAVGLVLVAGCSSTPASRISRHEAEYAEWPQAVRAKVQAGQVDLGFKPEQVRVALGEPDRVFDRTDANGTSQIWAYRDRSPRFGFGLGLGLGRGAEGSIGLGTGVAINSGGYRDDERMHVIFTGGRVSAVESTRTP